MIEFFQFATSGFWTFIGVWILVAVVAEAVVHSLRAIFRR
jgi:hypothetical protein